MGTAIATGCLLGGGDQPLFFEFVVGVQIGVEAAATTDLEEGMGVSFSILEKELASVLIIAEDGPPGGIEIRRGTGIVMVAGTGKPVSGEGYGADGADGYLFAPSATLDAYAACRLGSALGADVGEVRVVIAGRLWRLDVVFDAEFGECGVGEIAEPADVEEPTTLVRRDDLEDKVADLIREAEEALKADSGTEDILEPVFFLVVVDGVGIRDGVTGKLSFTAGFFVDVL